MITRPIVFIDLETTGVDVRVDKIVEISVIKYFNNQTEKITQKVNPLIHIPEQATEVHGITDEMVSFEPPFTHIAPMLFDFIQECDIAGFNSNSFDLRMLFEEFKRSGIHWDHRKHNLIDVGNMFKALQPRTLRAAYKTYFGVEHDGSHGAEADAGATMLVMFEMLEKHKDELPTTIEELALFSNFGKPILDLSGCFTVDDENDIVFAIGKHRGKKAKNEKDYLKWMLKSTFNEDTKDVAQKLLENDK